MNTLLHGYALVLCAALAMPAMADPPPPFTAPGIVIENFGVHCNVETEGTLEAPATESGFINLMSGIPEFSYRHQAIPARLGISFGVVAVSESDIFGTRLVTWKPGATEPEYWYSDMVAGQPTIQGYMFETPDELITGPWRLEAYDGETQLYSVAFEVLPGAELPGVTSDCNLLS